MKRIAHSKQSGFTIVELLIVIVVIGILATIILVSYTGAQAYANTKSASANASSLQRKIEAYNESANSFPDAQNAADYTTELNSTGDSSITSSNLVIGTPSASNGTTTLEVSQCASQAGAGYRSRSWDFSAKALSSNVILGNLGSSTCSSWQVLS